MTALDASGQPLAGFRRRRVLPPRRNRSEYDRVSHMIPTATVDRQGRLLLAGNYRIDHRFASGDRKVFRLAKVAGVDIEASDVQHVAVDDRDRIVVAGNVYDDEYVDRENFGSPYPAIAP